MQVVWGLLKNNLIGEQSLSSKQRFFMGLRRLEVCYIGWGFLILCWLVADLFIQTHKKFFVFANIRMHWIVVEAIYIDFAYPKTILYMIFHSQSWW